MKISHQQTLEQQRAAQAWDCIGKLDKQEDYRNKYGTLARKIPSLIQANGLGQTLAFLRSKVDQKAHQDIYDHLSVWVMGQLGQENQKATLLEWIIKQPSSTYRRATTEAMAFAQWLKRFAEAQGLGENGEQ